MLKTEIHEGILIHINKLSWRKRSSYGRKPTKYRKKWSQKTVTIGNHHGNKWFGQRSLIDARTIWNKEEERISHSLRLPPHKMLTNDKGTKTIEEPVGHHLNQVMKVNITTVGQLSLYILMLMLWEWQGPSAKYAWPESRPEELCLIHPGTAFKITSSLQSPKMPRQQGKQAEEIL